MCRRAGLVSVGVVEIDGTKVAASASREANGSYEQILAEAAETDGRVIALAAGNVVSIQHLRDTGAWRFNQTRVELVLETRDPEHKRALFAAMADAG